MSSLRQIFSGPRAQVPCVLSRPRRRPSRLHQPRDPKSIRPPRRLRGEEQISRRHQIRLGPAVHQTRSHEPRPRSPQIMDPRRERIHPGIRGHEQHQRKRLPQRDCTGTLSRAPAKKLPPSRGLHQDYRAGQAMQHPLPQDLEPARLQSPRLSA